MAKKYLNVIVDFWLLLFLVFAKTIRLHALFSLSCALLTLRLQKTRARCLFFFPHFPAYIKNVFTSALFLCSSRQYHFVTQLAENNWLWTQFVFLLFSQTMECTAKLHQNKDFTAFKRKIAESTIFVLIFFFFKCVTKVFSYPL